jgi:hypothetical protein
VRPAKAWPVRFLIFPFAFCILAFATWILLNPTSASFGEAFVLPSENEMNRDDGFTVLTANVGNLDLRCLPYYLKMCRPDVEARIARSIQELRPDVVAIQETLPDWMCASWPVAVPGSVCAAEADVPQIRRLLGPDYTIVCEARNGFECIAVRVDAGEILGCELGALCETDRADRQGEGCRWNVAIMAATVRVEGQVFDVVNAHPESRSAACRLASIRQIFENTGQPDSLVREEQVLLLGDFNMATPSAALWDQSILITAGLQRKIHPIPRCGTSCTNEPMTMLSATFSMERPEFWASRQGQHVLMEAEVWITGRCMAWALTASLIWRVSALWTRWRGAGEL